MRIITDNEGKQISVPKETFDGLYRAYKDDVWSVITKIEGKTHCIILHDNFYNYDANK